MSDERLVSTGSERSPGDADEERWPILFMVFVGLAGLYVTWRVVQLIWLALATLF